MLSHFSHIQLFVIPWTLAHQAPLSMGFPWQEYWSGLQFSSPEDLPDTGIKPASPALAVGFFTTETPVILTLLFLSKPQHVRSSHFREFL